MTESKFTLHTGNAKEILSAIPAQSVQTCVTSPPYWGLRDYGTAGQLGLEATPKAYVQAMVDIFAGVWKVLKDDGTLWLNLGDSYAANRGSKHNMSGGLQTTNRGTVGLDAMNKARKVPSGFKSKDLVGIPWRVAFALQEAGWYLRSDIVWAKPNPMPESVIDRPTRSHEYIFLLSKKPKYFYDAEAIKENSVEWNSGGGVIEAGGMLSGAKDRTGLLVAGEAAGKGKQRKSVKRGGFEGKTNQLPGREAFRAITEKRNKRDVWTVSTKTFPEAHFAVFPPELITPCILAGSRPGDTVLDPFSGSGTTGIVSLKHGRRYVGIDLNPEYNRMAEGRLGGKIYERPNGKEVQQQTTLF